MSDLKKQPSTSEPFDRQEASISTRLIMQPTVSKADLEISSLVVQLLSYPYSSGFNFLFSFLVRRSSYA
jgi:hypothetical protein